MRLIIATNNKSKVKEIKQILKKTPFKIVSLADLPKKFVIRETGRTFCQNAKKKSIPVSISYKDDYVVGEDSGLSVDWLQGGPGVYSARYSRPDATDLKNNQKLLKVLSGLPKVKRKAKFNCFLSLAIGGKELACFKGELRGQIATQPKGKNGFGYDPIFYIPGLKKTAAQLTAGEKNKVSHRAKAFLKLKKFLLKTK